MHLLSISNIGEVRCLHRAQIILKDQNTNPSQSLSICCHLTKDTEVSAAISPYYGAVSFQSLRDSLLFCQLVYFVAEKDLKLIFCSQPWCKIIHDPFKSLTFKVQIQE